MLTLTSSADQQQGSLNYPASQYPSLPLSESQQDDTPWGHRPCNVSEEEKVEAKEDVKKHEKNKEARGVNEV